MRQRTRKKWLKKHGQYIAPKELWNLDYTVAKFVLPRLIKFKENSLGFPGYGEADTMNKWQDILQKMITAFDYIVTDDDWWVDDPRYDYFDGFHVSEEKKPDEKFGTATVTTFILDDWAKEIEKNQSEERDRRNETIKEGLELFSKYFRHLWW